MPKTQGHSTKHSPVLSKSVKVTKTRADGEPSRPGGLRKGAKAMCGPGVRKEVAGTWGSGVWRGVRVLLPADLLRFNRSMGKGLRDYSTSTLA